MAEDMTPAFDRQLLTDALRPGELVIDPPLPYEGDLRDTYGYQIYPVRDASGEEGSSVFLVMEQPGDGVEPVTLVGEATLTISPVAGEGIVVMNIPGEGVRSDLLTADGGPNDGDDTTVLEKGWSYAYLNTGDGPFVIRDDCYPGFKPEYEQPVTDPDVLQALAEYGIMGASDEL